MFSFITNMFSTSNFSKWEDSLSKKGVLRATASGMHNTANRLRTTADYLDSKASILEAHADRIEMEAFALQIKQAMEETSPQDVVAIPASKLGSMPNSDIYNTLGIDINGIAGTAY